MNNQRAFISHEKQLVKQYQTSAHWLHAIRQPELLQSYTQNQEITPATIQRNTALLLYNNVIRQYTA